MKYLIIGYGRHGKDTFGDIMTKELKLNKSKSSSEFCSEKVLYPALKDKYNYKSANECFEDRHNHRAEWYDLISAYNTPDKTKLAAELLKEYDIYIGLRSREELLACKAKNLFDLIIWVDASDRLPPEGKDSMTIIKSDADIVIENNLTLEEFELKSKRFLKRIYIKEQLQKVVDENNEK
jgi:hypothetical protein